MEIIESIAWIGLGFVPTLLTLEFVSRKRGSLSAYPARKVGTINQGVAA